MILHENLALKTRSEHTKALSELFPNFADAQGLSAIPASADLVAAFLQSRIDAGVAPVSLDTTLTAIRNAHRAENQPDPTDDARVRAIAQGYRRLLAEDGRRSKQAKGLSESDLRAIVAAAAVVGDIKSTRDIALISLLREGLLRRSECAALRVRDFSRETDGSGRLRITRSKTDQAGKGATLFLGKQATDRVVKWLDAAPADGNAPLFRWIRRGGHIQSSGLSGEAIHKIVRSRGEAANVFSLSRTLSACGHGAISCREQRQHSRDRHSWQMEICGHGNTLCQPPKRGARRRREISWILTGRMGIRRYKR